MWKWHERCYFQGMRHLAAALLLTIFVPLAQAETAPQSTDLTPQFAALSNVHGLRAVQVRGIVLLRGETDDPAAAQSASAMAQSLGYARVANLIRVVDKPDDQQIERMAERQLATRTLDGCSFHVDSNNGVVTLDGKVRYELQRDLAMALVRNINGVREVRSSLQR